MSAADPDLALELHLDAETNFPPDTSGHNLRAEGSANVLAAGRFGNAWQWSGPGGIGVVSDPVLEPARVSVLAWVKRSGSPGRYRTIVGKGGIGCSDSSYGLITGVGDGPEFYVRMKRSDASTFIAKTTEAPPATIWDGNWHALAGTFDGDTVRMWVDGVQVATAPVGAGAIDYHPGTGASELAIANYPRGENPACDYPSFQYSGAIDEVRVYGRALSAPEVAYLQRSDHTTPPELPAPGVPAPGGGAGSTSPIVVFQRFPGAGVPGGTTILNASGTKNATRLDWDLNGNKTPDVTCPGSQPYLSVTPQTTATASVVLTATGAAGAPASLSSRVLLAGRDPPKSLAKFAPPDIATCSTTIKPLLSVLLMKFCENQTVVWRLISAQGCFVHSDDETDVPASERKVVKAHYDSEQYNATVASICRQTAAGTLPASRCDDAKRIFGVKYDVYVARKQIDLNGIKITPKGGAAVVVFPKLDRVISHNATMTWGGMTVRTGMLDLNLKNASNIHFTGGGNCACGRSAAIARYDGRRDLPNIAGFKLDGSVDLALEGINGRRYSSGVLQLRLPPEFGIFGGNPPSGSVRVLGENGKSPVFDNLDLAVPEAYIGPVRLTDVRFRYALHGGIDRDTDPNSNCTRKEWKAQGNIYISGGGKGGEAGFKLAPPPAQNGVGFCAGGFRHAGGALVFGGPIPRPEIFPGVFLDEINFAIRLHPVLVRGGGQLSVADISRVRGGLLLVFATPQEPYTLTPGDAGTEFKELAGRVFDSTTIVGGGAVSLNFPVIGYVPVGSAAAMYSYPDHIAAGGQVRIVGPGIAFYGHAAIEARLNQGLFTAAVGGKACLAGVKSGLCIGGDGWVTSKGIVACLNIFDTLHPGAGVAWATRKLTIWPIDGCKPSRYWVKFSHSARLAAADTVSFTVGKGEGVKNIRLPGVGAAPKVRITAPGGETLDVGGDDWVRSSHMAGVRDQQANVTYFGVKGGPAGTYKVAKLPGSAKFGGLSGTRKGYDTAFTAKVVGSGAQRRLLYDARAPGGGQRVTFVERGQNVLRPLKTVTGGRGAVTFTPSPGRVERRQIIAVAAVDGTPIADQTLASFRFGGTKRIARPASVKVRRRGTTLTVTWSKVAGATAYGVLLKFGVGKERQLTAAKGRRSLTLTRVPLTEGGTVRVSARDALGHWGTPRASNAFKATRALPTAIQTNQHNEKRGR